MANRYAISHRSCLRYTRRRWTLLLVILSFCAIIFLSASSSTGPSLPINGRHVTVPHLGDSFLNPFRQPSHPPPRQQNDTYAGSTWWADWKWLSVPFSSSLTLDDDRTILPPLPDRQPIYCYYDTTLKKSREEKDAESALLLTWRRAWWANGFRPVILSASEALNNPLYPEIQRLKLAPELKTDLMRWLAWETMGGGLLSQYTLLPMASLDDPLPYYFRRGDYARLMRWEGLEDGLVAGNSADISSLLRSIAGSAKVAEVTSVISAAEKGEFQVDPAPASLAYYSPTVIEKKYGKIAAILSQHKVEGLKSLAQLINAHLHVAWQNRFPDGIEVLKPLPNYSTAMVSAALSFARQLAACSESPLPSTCPPNLPKCNPCVGSSQQMRISTPAWYHNSTRRFAIGTVPHPWSLALVLSRRESIDVGWIVNDAPRDPWLRAVTQLVSGGGVSIGPRVVSLKQAIASLDTTFLSLWFTAEAGVPKDADWLVGFTIPRHPVDYGNSLSPVPADRLVKDKAAKKVDRDKKKWEAKAAEEAPLLERAKEVVALTKASAETKLRASIEAWNLGDSEAWRFTKAFQARREMEREAWEADEAKYTGGAGSEGGRSSWSRWQNRVIR